MEKYVKDILSAKVYDVAIETPIQKAAILSQRFNNEVLLKREDLQPVHSFKLRGAYNKMVGLSDEAAKKGVIAASAGNHAQGVAMAGTRLGIKTIIVMPVTTPKIKIDAVKSLGGKVILHGDTYNEAATHAQELVKEKGYTFVHAFDDAAVIAGQGTVGLEIVRQHSGRLDAIFVPVGGGGLMAGIAAYIKFIRPEIKLIAVESEDSACLQAALKAQRRVVLSQVGLFADGVAVAQIGKETFRILRKLVDDVVTVTTDEICAAVKDVFDDTRAVTEPAGALAIAGMKKYVREYALTGKTLLAVVTGANVNFDRLRHISERTELGEHREAVLAVTIDERPGSFRHFSSALGKRNITEFNYRYGDPVSAKIFVGIEINDTENGRRELLTDLKSKHFKVVDMSDNEAAKLHIRHMVGGRNQEIDNERVYRFEFPERPGALMKFLDLLGGRWNISMFHYRNHGAAYGRVLVGVQIPSKDKKQFAGFLKEIGYRHWDETDNIAYQTFLAAE
ncbi:MAG: threonine ammonia-lyase, biosynthetic [Gammaproteobacteria bacterium]|nr:threonine ammonia-lyase, biosynthetic [Gammaproteobacteria bacterium]MDP2348461.1 threonine ammonia-lyase, biosynthetic [Gammaproteobacteria bacterium]